MVIIDSHLHDGHPRPSTRHSRTLGTHHGALAVIRAISPFRKEIKRVEPIAPSARTLESRSNSVGMAFMAFMAFNQLKQG